ncbi:hypothetical protein MACK_003669 [Theileria orientalis]|uniref:Uncharacterized protein n=1 Tax=Theileria orientalis TaxID=68886 RepID=A0A976SJM4_THEOR|nr:hypothetical protein MACK_003669 [Theileria orientalis]
MYKNEQKSGSTSPGTGTQATTPAKEGTGSGSKTDNKSNDKFEYQKEGNYVTYTAKGDNAFQEVKDGNTEVWKATDANSYSSKVEVDLMNNQPKVVTVHLDNTTKLFEKKSDDKSWQEIDTSKVNPRSLNIKYQHESYFCTNVVQCTTRTFTAKTGFAFKLVYELIDKKTRSEIWKTDKESEYALKVVVEGGNKLTIYIGSGGSTKVFKKGSDDIWTEDTAASIKSCDTGNSEGTKTCVELSLKATAATDEFDYNKAGQALSHLPPKISTVLNLLKLEKMEI